MTADRGTTEEQLHDAKRGVSILVACLVQELEVNHPGLTERYCERLGKAYSEVREEETQAVDRLELINWTRTLLTGWNPVTGQEKPFLT